MDKAKKRRGSRQAKPRRMWGDDPAHYREGKVFAPNRYIIPPTGGAILRDGVTVMELLCGVGIALGIFATAWAFGIGVDGYLDRIGA